MRRTLPLWLSPLPFMLFALLLIASPARATESVEHLPPDAISQAHARLIGQVLATPPSEADAGTPALPQTAPVPDLGLGEVLSLVARAFAGRQWGLLGVLALLGLVFLLRKAGGRYIPFLDTPRGAVVLSLVGGTGTLLAAALSAGTPFSLGLVLSCLMTAASASGLWSWGQSLKKPSPAVICTPTEIANGTCRPT